MAITAAQLNVILTATGAKEVVSELNAVNRGVKEAATGFDAFFDSIQGGAGNALRMLDGFSKVMGAIGVAGGISLITGGAKAAWDQVDAVEQATIALRAYEKDARKVDKVLADLLKFARSDQGKLFMRQELFDAAQNLKMYGDETENLVDHVQILSRAIALGTTDWESLNAVVGRVGATGKLTADDFYALRTAGYQLDESLKGTTITFEELFDALDKGSVIVEGQSNTIKGLGITITSALRGIGLSFLGVDSETSQFIEGGLGAKLIEWMKSAPAAIGSFKSTAADLGNTIVSVVNVGENLVGFFQMLPQPIQSAVGWVLKLVTAFGAFRVAGSALGMVTGALGLGGLVGGIGSLLGGGLFKSGATGATSFAGALGTLLGRLNPVGLAITGVAAVGGYLINSFMEQKKATEDYANSVANLEAVFESLRRQGLRDRATAGEGLMGEFEKLPDRMNEFLKAFDPANLDTMNEDEIINLWKAITGEDWRGDMNAAREDITAHWAKIRSELELSTEDITSLNDKMLDALNDPNIDVDSWMNWAMGLLTGAQNAEELNAAVQLILDTPLSDWAKESADSVDSLDATLQKVGATAEEVSAIFDGLPARLDDLRVQGLDKEAADVERLAAAWEAAFKPIGEYQMDRNGQDTGVFKVFDELDAEKLDALGASWERISQAISSGDFDNARLLADVMTIINDPSLTLDQKADAIEKISVNLSDYSWMLAETQEAMQDWLGTADNILKFWLEYDRLTGSTSDAGFRALVEQVVELNKAAGDLDRVLYYFEQIDALGQRSSSAGSIAENLVGKPGEWATIDDLVTSGRISWEQYNDTVAAGYSIMESNSRVQEHLNKMRADQLPLLEQEQLAYEKQIEALSQLPAIEQRRALAMQDSAYQAQVASMYSTAYAASLGEMPEEVATSIIVSAAEADPVLKDLLLNFGLIEEGADGTISVNFPDGPTVQDAITSLTESIDALIETLGGVPPLHVDTSEAAPAVEEIDAVTAAFERLQAARIVSTTLPPMPSNTPDDGNDYYPGTNVPVVTGLPNAGSGEGTITVDNSQAMEAIHEVNEAIAEFDDLEVTFTIAAGETDWSTWADTEAAAAGAALESAMSAALSSSIGAGFTAAVSGIYGGEGAAQLPTSNWEGWANTEAAAAAAALETALTDQLGGSISSAIGGIAPADTEITITADTSTALGSLAALRVELALLEGMDTTVSVAGRSDSADDMISRLSAYEGASLALAIVWAIGESASADEMISRLSDYEGAALADVYVWGIGRSDSADAMISRLSDYDGAILATTYVDVVTRTSSIPGRATGGIVQEPLTWVGENGPELVALPYGSRVYTNAQSMAIASNRDAGLLGYASGGGHSDNRSFNVSVNVDASGGDYDEEQLAELAATRTMQAMKILMTEQRSGVQA